MTNTGGLNWYPASSFAPEGEWGRADTDRRPSVRVFEDRNAAPLGEPRIFCKRGQRSPVQHHDGRDDNRDGMAVDRPAGVTRNTGRGPEIFIVAFLWPGSCDTAGETPSVGASRTVLRPPPYPIVVPLSSEIIE